MRELERRGFATVPEPGRRIVEEEQRGEGKALPWVDLEAFAKRAIEMSFRDRQHFDGATEWVFFDRGLVDAAVALEHATGLSADDTLTGARRFHRQVFLTPPWPEIYETDGERQHDLSKAVDEYQRLLDAYDRLGYEKIILPKIDVTARADFILSHLR